jgi:two-component system, response regulator PdtaR
MSMLQELTLASPPHWLNPRLVRAPSDGPEAAPRSVLRVLIVEDEALFALDLEDLVRELGHRPVGMVATQAEAVGEAVRLKPDLVFMDIRLAQGGDGLAAAREIRRRTGIPCIFITAHSDATTRAQAADAGGLAYLVKPVDKAELAGALERAARLMKG